MKWQPSHAYRPSAALPEEFGRGFSRSNLMTRANGLSGKSQTTSGKWPAGENCQTPSGRQAHAPDGGDGGAS